MSQPSAKFSLRSLARGSTTLTQLRHAVLAAAARVDVVLVQYQAAGVQFPPICPNCEQPAATPLRIERAFLMYVYGGDDTPNEVVASIDSFDIPFCDACIGQHRAQLVPLSPWIPLKRILSDGTGFGGVIVLGIALMFLKSAVERFSLFPVFLAALPFTVGFWLLRTRWNKTRHMSVPAPTNVDLAVDFTPTLSEVYEPGWRAFVFRSPRYAELFSRQNLNALWNPNSMEAQAAAAKRREHSSRTNYIVGAVVVAVLIWFVWDEYLSPLITPYLNR